METNTHYLWAGLKAKARERAHKTSTSLKTLYERLRYGTKNPEVWQANWLKFKDGLKGQTSLVEEKSRKREIHTNYIHD